MPSPRRFPSFQALLTLSGLILYAAGCDEGPSGPTHFTIVSPGAGRVAVLPGDTVHFQVQLNAPGFRVEYLVDGEDRHDGPGFDFVPTLVEHIVRISIIPEGSTAPPDVREFSVGVEVPGNTPPSILSFGHSPEIAEALRDTFVFSLSAADSDGTVARVVLDFGDGTNPVTVTSGPQVQVTHVFPTQGTYEVKATVFDDDQVAVAARDTAEALPPNQFPTGSLVVDGAAEGDAPFAVTLRTSGSDVDGQIVRWEIDTDLGNGFVQIAPDQTVHVTYPYREEAFRPKLRLTDDDGDSSVIEADRQLLVFRQISASRSNVSVQGNAAFGSTQIAPAIWADGQDAFVVTIEVRAPDGSPVPDAPVQVTALRPELVAPDGRNFGVPVFISPQDARTDGSGLATVQVGTNTSTRVEAAPEISFVPFGLQIQADRGHGQMVTLEGVERLNAETTIGSSTGQVFIRSASGQGGYCAGDLVNIIVDVDARSGAPGGGGPASERFTVIRTGKLSDPEIIPTTPGPGFESWRTNGSGEVILQFRPGADQQANLIVAWVDGQPLDDLQTFNFSPSCP